MKNKTMADLIDETRSRIKLPRGENLISRLRRERTYAEMQFNASQNNFSMGRYWEGYLAAIDAMLHEVEKL